MSRIVSSGKCRLCGRLFGKAQMTKHLQACVRSHAEAAPAKKGKPVRAFYLVVTATYDPRYWLHMEVPANVTFRLLDGVLRNIWLECCYHLSAFTFPREPSPKVSSDYEFKQILAGAARLDWEDDIEEQERLMRARVGSKFEPGIKFKYEYDFGSTTHLSLRVVDEWPASSSKAKIRLLARNEPPDIRCALCDKPATTVCAECYATNRDSTFCDACAAAHPCGDDMLMPVVNSPRMGVCGYCGPSVEP
ncbi:MAG: plasmid pRiA4b ORF-3 family protein [Verrucomicrobia bacterium]|nr:plasmid pRiA4b ORF-3 family protein [Verrucomicrobiota bacterium]